MFDSALAQNTDVQIAQKSGDAEETDPVMMGWMIGSPPPPDKIIRFSDGGSSTFPKTRWSFSNSRQFIPSTVVARDSGPVSLLPPDKRADADIDNVSFQPLVGVAPMTWKQSLAANYTDGIVVLHDGKIVYERYFGVLTPEKQHVVMSVTKSFFGTIGAMLVAEGLIDETAAVSEYIEELEGTGFGDATIRQVLDMLTGIKYSEDYTCQDAEIYKHMLAGSMIPRPSDYGDDKPQTFYEYLETVKKEGDHGKVFAYKTVNTDVLGWVIRRVTKKSVGENLQEMIWSKLGTEQDAYFSVDTIGNEFAGGGLNLCLRDMARFGETMRLDGFFNGQQIVPKAVVADIRNGGDRELFAAAGYRTLPGWSYRNMWWVSHNKHGAYMARGVHGQAIYIDPAAKMVIARLASNKTAANAPDIDNASLPAYHALAEYLMTR
ncbi:serine hydrolase domain-containing protein [Collimonas humicola]|uniref:serine hydrolase domain-containing protein n=1 Tax=Collimonas humicola TaxID=2825886 RepID=UPI001B8D5EF9|nr:serine hydrolase [Collimonas humicola]